MHLTLTVKKVCEVASKLILNTSKNQSTKTKKREKKEMQEHVKQSVKIDRPNHFQRPWLGAEIFDAPAWVLKLFACLIFRSARHFIRT